MANLISIAEQAYRQLFPRPSDETKLRKGDFVATAKALYATLMWVKAKQEKREEGFWDVPPFLISEKEYDVKNNEIDISDIKPLTSLDNAGWLLLVGEVSDPSCRYIKTTISRMQAMHGDDAFGEKKTYLPLKKKIRFPRGVYKNKVSIVYANNGEDISDTFEMDEGLAGTLRDKLIETYGGRTGNSDVTNNSNSEQ